MPRRSAVYGSHHEQAELAALLSYRAEAEYEPGNRRGTELAAWQERSKVTFLNGEFVRPRWRWLGFVDLVAGPYQVVLLVTAVALLVSGGIILWRHSAVVCADGQTCTSSRSSIGKTITLSLGAILVALSVAFV